MGTAFFVAKKFIDSGPRYMGALIRGKRRPKGRDRRRCSVTAVATNRVGARVVSIRGGIGRLAKGSVGMFEPPCNSCGGRLVSAICNYSCCPVR